MLRILKQLLGYFKGEKTVYSHRDRSIEIVAKEQGVNIDLLKEEIRVVLEKEGRVEAIEILEKRFHVPLNSAWRFVDKLDSK